MQTVQRSEVLPLGEYEAIRDHFRARVIVEKKARRVELGEHVWCLFENHDTVLMQIQEMLRTERITKESAILHELETYNSQIPGPSEISATIMIGIQDAAQRDAFLAAAKGFEDHVALGIDGEIFKATYPTPLAPAERTTAVHYMKFTLSEAAREKLAKAKNGDLHVDLVSGVSAYVATTRLPASVVASLAEDFA